MSSDRDVWVQSELAAELYVDDLVDGQGLPIGDLTEDEKCVRLDKVGSVSGLILDPISLSQISDDLAKRVLRVLL